MQGIVQKINIKPYDGKNLYSFFLKGQDGMYSLGERAPSFKEGDSIQFETLQRGKYVNAVNVAPWVSDGTTTAPTVTSTARKIYNATGGKSLEEKAYWNKRDATQEVTQRRIEIQAARNAAIEAARFLIEKEFVKTPTKQADKYDSYLALVNQLADEFLSNTATRLDGRGAESTASGVSSERLGLEGSEAGSVGSNDEAKWA